MGTLDFDRFSESIPCQSLAALNRQPMSFGPKHRNTDIAEEHSSESIRRAIYATLRELGYSDLRQVKCIVVDGDVQLLGDLKSFYMKQLAQTAAMKIVGVRQLTNSIRVVAIS